MNIFKKMLSVAGLLVSASAFVLSGTASAHVVVRPAEVVTAGFQTFTVGVPNEKDIPTTSIELLIPEGLQHVSPTQKSGWEIDIDRQGEGEDSTIRAITWSGGQVDVGMRDDFTFSAKVPDNATELQWKAYQTYADGTVVAWDKSSTDTSDHEEDNSGPFSVTKVVAETAQAMAISKADQAAADATSTANRALYIGIAGLAVGLIGVFLAVRKQ